MHVVAMVVVVVAVVVVIAVAAAHCFVVQLWLLPSLVTISSMLWLATSMIAQVFFVCVLHHRDSTNPYFPVRSQAAMALVRTRR